MVDQGFLRSPTDSALSYVKIQFLRKSDREFLLGFIKLENFAFNLSYLQDKICVAQNIAHGSLQLVQVIFRWPSKNPCL